MLKRISSVEFGEEKAIKTGIIIYFPNATDFETSTLTFTLVASKVIVTDDKSLGNSGTDVTTWPQTGAASNPTITENVKRIIRTCMKLILLNSLPLFMASF
ncbi:hypothetical protein N8301_04135 [Cyclobacteriaceae bacterium]|nr:hypothetical protein [Cyclobacteriaceae bacterium]